VVRLWERRAVASRWGVPPPWLDEIPHAEVLLELQLLGIEAAAKGPPRAGPDEA